MSVCIIVVFFNEMVIQILWNCQDTEIGDLRWFAKHPEMKPDGLVTVPHVMGSLLQTSWMLYKIPSNG